MYSSVEPIAVGARSSNLSRAQTQEVLKELKQYYPRIEFQMTYLPTIGDKDLKTSLRSLEKTDFFTKEIDELVQKKQCRIGIHSAKDLPDPLAEGLMIAALTKGVEAFDSLVLREKDAIETLRPGAIIGTSSKRREEMVHSLRQDLHFKDIRGTIENRLALLENGEVDGIVIAEAAILRLGLAHLNRIRLPGEAAPLQGQLAIISRCDDLEMETLFYCIDSRRQKK